MYRSLLAATVKRGTKRTFSDVSVSSLPKSVSKGPATRPSLPIEHIPVLPVKALDKVRRFDQGEICIDKQNILGKGVFGKCYLGSVGPLQACVKVLRKGQQYEASFINEVNVLSQCCHPNIPLLFGTMTTCAGYKCLLMSFHGISGVSYSVHSLLAKEADHLVTVAWKKVIVGSAKGLRYLHNHDKGPILHNDLKSDNIVVGNSFDYVEPCIVDFGKACFQQNAKLYHLSTTDKEVYRKRHPQVAPELRDGISKQSTASDVYSFGRILSAINKEKLSIPVLTSMSAMCLDYDYDKRPSTNDLCTFLENLLL